MNKHVDSLKTKIEAERQRLLSHPAYKSINDLNGLKDFTEVHVYAVWDFMSLLKSLQIALTSVSLPWVPVGSANTRYLINEIVLGEESDVDENGDRISHFELYLAAMRQMNADTTGIEQLLQLISEGQSIQEAINQVEAPAEVKQFLRFTFQIAINAKPHVKASVFTFGREDLIPAMFHKLLEQLYAEAPSTVSIFKYYIERHIEVDGDHHSQLAIDMVSELCGDDKNKWQEATEAALQALRVRFELWNAVQKNVQPVY